MEIKPEGMEKTAWIIHWDIPSEGFKFLKPTDKDSPAEKTIKSAMFNKIASVRLQSANKLYELGLPSSNSVLLVPNTVIEQEIDNIIASIEEQYKNMNKMLVASGLLEIGQPFIRKVPIVKFQFTIFKEMAERKLMVRLDESLTHLAKKINELVTLEEDKKKQHAARYKNEIKDIEEMREMAKKLGIVADDKFDLLNTMFKKAISVVS